MPLAVIPWFLLHAGAVLLMLAAAWTPGWWLTRSVRFDSPLERGVFTIAIGLGVWCVGLLGIAALGLLFRPLIVVLTIVWALPAVWMLTVYARGWRPTAKQLTVVVVLVAGWSFLFFQVLFPPTQWDALSHHLVFAREQLRAHGAAVALGTPHAVLPAMNHYLFVWAMALQSDITAQAMQHVLFILAAAGMVAWGMRSRQLLTGVAAAAIWLAHPLVLTLSESAYIDVGNAAIVFLCLYALRIFVTTGDPRFCILGMALVGMAAGTKVFSLFFLASASVLMLFWTARGKLTVRDFGATIAAATIFGLPWFLFITWASGGDPVWPLLPHLARGIWAQIPGFEHPAVGLAETPLNFLLVPIRMATNPILFGPDFYLSVNPIVALWPLAWLVSFRDSNTRWWTLWGLAYTAAWFLSAQYVRYWIPAVPLIGLSLAESLRWCLGTLGAPRALRIAAFSTLALYCSIAVVQHLASSFLQKGWPPVTAPQRLIYERAFLSGYGGVKFINERAAATDTVFVLNAGYLNYPLKPRVIDFFGVAASPRIIPRFSWPRDAAFVARFREWNVRWILIRHQGSEWLAIPETDLASRPFWPGYKLAYQDSEGWVLERE